MLTTTRGIVFHQLKYSETSLIVKIYTEQLGLQSFLVKGARSRRSRFKPAFFQPLNILEIVTDYREKKSLLHLRDLRPEYVFQSLNTDILKSSIIIFLNEVLYKCVREEESNPELFAFLSNSLKYFDLKPENYLNFHLHFLIRLTRFLGFYPSEQLDLQQVKDPYKTYFFEMAQTPISQIDELGIPSAERITMLDQIIDYYRLHMPDLKEINSHKVLKEVLR